MYELSSMTFYDPVLIKYKIEPSIAVLFINEQFVNRDLPSLLIYAIPP
jgi:hypothetical protein